MLAKSADEIGIVVEWERGGNLCGNNRCSSLGDSSHNGLGYSQDNGIITITLPCLIPNRKKKPADFITTPLYATLERFVLDNQGGECEETPQHQPFQKFNHCVICITHVYDKALLAKGRKRDHDNVELKGIIDVINSFLLTDDSDNLCDIYNTSKISDKDFTVISIMSKEIFPSWILGYRTG